MSLDVSCEMFSHDIRNNHKYSCVYAYTNPNNRLRSFRATSKSGHEPCQLRLANVVIGDLFRGAETQLP